MGHFILKIKYNILLYLEDEQYLIILIALKKK